MTVIAEISPDPSAKTEESQALARRGFAPFLSSNRHAAVAKASFVFVRPLCHQV